MKATRIGALMVDAVVTAESGTPFKDVARRLGEHRISGLPVVDGDDKVVGVISETDLMLRQVQEPGTNTCLSHLRRLRHNVRESMVKSHARTAGGLMSAPAVTVRADSSVREAARLMAEHRIERLPVVDEEDRLVGIVTRHELLKAFLRSDHEIRQDVQQQVFVDTLWLAPYTIGVAAQDGVVTLTGRMERRSDIPVALDMTRRIDGVVDVVNHLSYRIDDKHLRPAEQALHGVADDWLRKL